jgi:hypothetical protein
MTALALYPVAVGLMLVGAALAWPVARRVGERRPDGLYWQPVGSPHDPGRRWVPVQPRPARMTVLRAQLAGWWATTTPRDPHRPVHQAMIGTGRSPSWMSGLMGQPPIGSAL